MDWTLPLGAYVKRTELHDQYGGGRQGGIEPSAKSPNILLFANPAMASLHGYFDTWRDDGIFYYNGEGLKGDQRMTDGNKAIRDHAITGRALRLFYGSKGTVRYAGQLRLATDIPISVADALGNDKEMRSVFIFPLSPNGDVIREGLILPSPTKHTTQSLVEIEEYNSPKHIISTSAKQSEAVRREGDLVQDFKKYLKAKGLTVKRNRIDIAGQIYPLFTDMFIVERNVLIEAKGTIERGAFRTAIGQLADYRRYLATPPRCAILLPSEPPKDLKTLAELERLLLFWKHESGFAGSESAMKTISSF